MRFWSDFARNIPLLLALLLPAACGDLPQPFRGQPGGQAGDLAQPPGVRIAVPRPGSDALLDQQGGERMASALANALRLNEVPATAGAAFPLDWRVTMEAGQDGRSVTPRYTLVSASGENLGTVAGRPVPMRAWSEASEATLGEAARYAAPRVAELMLRAEARRRGTTPESLLGTAPRVYLAGVRGAPGDGNVALLDRLRGALGTRGIVPQDNAVNATFAVTGEVEMEPSNLPGEQVVLVIWTVSRRDGEDLGRVLQQNRIPARSLDRLWGDAAVAVAQEAAGGIRDVIRNAGGFPNTTGPEAGREGGLTIPANTSVLPPPQAEGAGDGQPRQAAPAPAPQAEPAAATPPPRRRRRAPTPPAQESSDGA